MNEPQKFEKRRIVAAFVFAPLIVALLVPLLWNCLELFDSHRSDDEILRTLALIPAIAFVAYLHLIMIGLPMFLFVKETKEITQKNCIGFGVAIGGLPIFIIITIIIFNEGLRNLSTWTLCLIPMLFAFIGAIIGYFFWHIGIKPRTAV